MCLRFNNKIHTVRGNEEKVFFAFQLYAIVQDPGFKRGTDTLTKYNSVHVEYIHIIV